MRAEMPTIEDAVKAYTLSALHQVEIVSPVLNRVAGRVLAANDQAEPHGLCSVVSSSGSSCLALWFLSRAGPRIDKAERRTLDLACGREASLMAAPRAVTLELAGITGRWWPVRHLAPTRDGEDRRVGFIIYFAVRRPAEGTK
jgi:hypothetical protein